MHEMSLAEGVLQLVEETAQRERAHRVRLVVVEIGRLSSVEPEALKFCFEAVASGGVAQGAMLEIIDVPGSGRCTVCAEMVPICEVHDVCPKCGGHPVRPSGGTEMRVVEMEIE